MRYSLKINFSFTQLFIAIYISFSASFYAFFIKPVGDFFDQGYPALAANHTEFYEYEGGIGFRRWAFRRWIFRRKST